VSRAPQFEVVADVLGAKQRTLCVLDCYLLASPVVGPGDSIATSVIEYESDRGFIDLAKSMGAIRAIDRQPRC
jgi:hypothetical protein